jgi:hypothetical protein
LKKAALIPAILIFSLSLSLALTAQPGSGDVQGRVADKEGKPMAGVKVILSKGQDADRRTTTDPAGRFRFPAVYPGSDYAIRAERLDYKTAVRSGVAVLIGGRVTVDLVLEPGKAEEQAAAPGTLPALDRKRMTFGTQFGRTELQTLPTVRDPWAIAALAPGVFIDRENVGGNESGRQAALVAKGDFANGEDNIWVVDGIDVTDPVKTGTSTVGFDFDAIETIAVTTGGAADVTQQTGGIALNLVGRRGGNRIGGSARLYLSDQAFQSTNMTTAIGSTGVVGTNRIEYLRDYGFSVGGPIIKNRIWFWGGFGSQDIYNNTIFGQPDRTLFSNFNFKLNAQPFAGNQFEAQIMASGRERYGDSPAFPKPEGNHVFGLKKLGDPVFKVQDLQTFGSNAYLSVKYVRSRTGSTSVPMVDEALANPVVWDVADAAYAPYSEAFGRSWDSSKVDRARQSIEFLSGLYKDSLLGMSHEFKFGLEISDKRSTDRSGYIHNFVISRDFVDPLIDLGEGLVVPPADYQYYRISRDNTQVLLGKQTAGFIQDTVTRGRITLTLGLRYDLQRPSRGALRLSTLTSNTAWTKIVKADAMSAVGTYFPAIDVAAVKSRYEWSTWSPRVGLSWDVKGNGRTIVKLTLAQYGDVMPAGYGTASPLGLTGGFGFWWKDADADLVTELGEIYWKYSSLHPETPNRLYALFDDDGDLTDAAIAALAGGFTSDAYLAGNYWDYDWANNDAVDYDNITTFYRSDVDPDAKNVKTSPRTREISLGLEREISSDLTASATATYRRYDNFDWSKLYYPADVYPSTPDLVVDNTATWYVPAGTVPASITVGEGASAKTYDLLDAGGRTWYLPSASFPGQTPYRMVDKSSTYRAYLGLELTVTKRLAKRWFMNGSLTLQDQRVHWKDSYVDPTNQWALDGQAYGNWGAGFEGKAPALMYARWAAKLSGLYQLPLGFSVSATLTARDGWKIPNYITLAYADPEAWAGLYRANVVYLQAVDKDSLSVMKNLSFRVEKSLKLGTGRLLLMADVFNVLNAATVNRADDANLGTYYVDTEVFAANPYYRLSNEILNPRIFRLGARFEF